MNTAQKKRFNSLYQQHISALRRQGKAEQTIDAYSRAVRRISEFFDQCPDKLTQQQLKDYFSALVTSHSWSTVKVDRNGLQFFYKQVLGKRWVWVDIVKPPQQKVLTLQVGDMDAGHMKVHIRQGKGRKDRRVTLPQRTLEALRAYWVTHRHPCLLFPAGKTAELRHEATQVMNRSGLQRSFKAIARSCGINKPVTIHTLRQPAPLLRAPQL